MIRYAEDGARFAREILGFSPTADQEELLRTERRFVMLNCHRQWGKTTVTAIRALHRAVSSAGQRIVIVSPTLRQSRVLADRCRDLGRRLKIPLGTDGTNPGSIVFPNGSVIFPLPAHPDKVRGFTAHFLIFDEAARIADEVFSAATPMLAATDGDLWLLSTPSGRSGFFYEEWMARDAASHRWYRLTGTAAKSGRLKPEVIENERRRKTAMAFEQEFECSFASAERSVFPDEWLERSFSELVPTFDECSRVDLRYAKHRPSYYLGLDLAKLRDYAALVLLEYRVIPTGKRDGATYAPLYRRELRVVLVERFRLGTEYHDLVARIARLCEHPHLQWHTQLVFDANGPGAVVEEMLRRAKLPVSLLPVVTSNGKQVGIHGSRRTVPKEKLVASLEVLFQQQHLKIAKAMPQADLLREELRHFECKSRRGGGREYGAGAGHDDLVMALAMAAWWAYENKRGALAGGELRALD